MNLYSHVSASGSELEPFPFPSELAMEGYLVENPNVLKLDNESPQILAIEKEWQRDEKGRRGRIDLLAHYGDSTIAVVELKNDEIGLEAFAQLESYFESKDHLKSVADSFQLESKDEINKFPWLGVLVGNSISTELKEKLISNNSAPDKIPVAAIILNRYKSGNQTYILTDVVFPKKGKDRSDYLFKGSKYKKGRLVLAMFKAYVDEHYGLNASGLKDLIKDISFRKPLLLDYETARRNDNTPNTKGNCVSYYFSKPEEALVLKDDIKLAVLNWWSIDDMPVIEKIAKALGYSFSCVS